MLGFRFCRTERCNLPFFSVTIIMPDENSDFRLCRRLCANLAMVGYMDTQLTVNKFLFSLYVI
ncbi:hypothetical protein EXT73_23830, partial [Pectobacterium atrosepticum]|nr:hypothetical protein [Pectobacterium atrosepticum]